MKQLCEVNILFKSDDLGQFLVKLQFEFDQNHTMYRDVLSH